MHVLGHSLGSLLLGYYLARHGEHVLSATLLSPLGLHRLTPDEQEQLLGDFQRNNGWAGALRLAML
jgi:alpha-beta hydrolase superfamily lysophospholipase